MVLIFRNPRTDLTLWDKAYFWLWWVLNELRLNPLFYYMLFIQATQWQQFTVIGPYQTDFSLESFSPVPEKLGVSPHSVSSLHPGYYGKRINLTVSFEQKEKHLRVWGRERVTEGDLQRRCMIDVPLIRWVRLADGSNMERIEQTLFAELAAPQKIPFLILLSESEGKKMF